jgi:copper transport protein
VTAPGNLSGRLVRVLAAACAAMLIAPAGAVGHAAFQDASPEPGARLSSAPARIVVAFSEPLSRALSTASLVAVRSGRRVAAGLSFRGARMVLRPARRLPTGAYRVRWHTVSLRDGHTLEGSFGFGVRTSALGGAAQLQQSPLARDGWLRVLLRAVWYASLFFFGAGVLCGVLLASPAGPAGWLLPIAGGPGAYRDREAALARGLARTRAVGWLAAAAGLGVALAETSDAAGSLSWHAIDAYLLSTASGGARVVAVAAVLAAVLLARQATRAAAAMVLAALAAVAVGGHANSASPRALALASDWVHLVAALVWAGGIAQIAATWLPTIGALAPVDRRRVIDVVLERFGRLALPAFALVVFAGVANAMIELGSVGQLWRTRYGEVLLAKMALVGVIAAASYLHAFVLRPRALSAGADDAAVRAVWRVLGAQPTLLVAVVLAAAVLVAFPVPPRQLLERAEAGGQRVGVPSLRPPQGGELAVAEEAGPWIAAAWVKPGSGVARGTLRLLDYRVHPVPARIAVAGASTQACGVGCVTFSAPRGLNTLRVIARLRHTAAVAQLPIAWRPVAGATARRILAAAVAATDRLRSFQIDERLTGGFGGPASISRYRISGRHEFEIVTTGAAPFQEIAIGRRVWARQAGGSWQEQSSSPLDTRQLMPWWTHRTGVRLLGLGGENGERTADIALADVRPLRVSIPFWFRLRIDLATKRVLAMRMVTVGHFMDQRYAGFNAPVKVTPPTGR